MQRTRTDFDSEAWIEGLRSLAERKPVEFPPELVPPHFKHSAVLIVFWPEDESLRVLLTRRSSRMSRHAGEVAFPGGLLEEGETPKEAALREAQEEVGLDPGTIEVVGRLDDAWSGAGSHMVPFVALAERRPSLVPSPAEVDEILTPDVRELLRPEARSWDVVERQGVQYRNDVIEFDGGSTYGLTTDILLETLERAQGEPSVRGYIRLGQLVIYHHE